MRSAGTPAFVPIQIPAPEVLGATALEELDGEVELTLGCNRRACVRRRVDPAWFVQALYGLEAPARPDRLLAGAADGVVPAPRGVMGAVRPVGPFAVHLPLLLTSEMSAWF